MIALLAFQIRVACFLSGPPTNAEPMLTSEPDHGAYLVLSEKNGETFSVTNLKKRGS